jgi:transposase InsO family protein
LPILVPESHRGSITAGDRYGGLAWIDEPPSTQIDQWAYEQGLQWHTIQPGRPLENSYVESFYGRFRDECLNEI